MKEMEKTSPPSSTEDDQKRLFDLTAQSWEMELAISGVAMFALLQFPDLLDQWYDYLRYDITTQTQGIPSMLLSLAYSMMKSASYVLFMAFMVNFIMRAYWVGLVGLLAVYPKGIDYRNLPFVSPYAQEQMSGELGPLDRYILKLDRRCNIVFALAFLFVLLIFFIAILYLLLLVIYLVFRPALSDWVWQLLTYIAYGATVVFLLSSIILSQKKVVGHPKGARLQYKLMLFTRGLMMGLYRPMSFISNTFYSNISKKSISLGILILFSIFMALFMVEYISDLSRINKRVQLFFQRHLYTARVDEHYVNPEVYDNMRTEDAYIEAASIQGDVIQEPFIRLFIAYPRTLDTLLSRVPEPIADKTLSREEARRQYAAWSSKMMSSIVYITVNDSVYVQPEVFFTQRGPKNQRGWQTILIPKNLQTGKNLLRVGLKIEGRPEPDELIAIPFWYVPNK